MSHSIEVRPGEAGDLEAIIQFNKNLAEETESKVLDHEVLRRGVESALADPDRLRYWVAEINGRVIGQCAVTREWSDWRNGWIWWLQSVYVATEARGQGVFRLLHALIRESALDETNVIGLRLYVDKENEHAQSVYRNLGMEPGGYLVFEELWPDRFSRAD